MSRRAKHLVVLALLITIAGMLVWHFSRPRPIEVTLTPVEKGLVERTVANTRAGTVKACRRARLSPGIGGQISRLEIHEGDTVRKGDLLLELWNRDLRAQINLNEAEKRAALASARASCLQAEVAQREADRLTRLRSSGAVSEDRLDKAATEAKAALASCQAADANVVVAEARAELARSQLDRTRLLAPFDGVVAEINGELNEYVTPSPPGIATPPAVDLIDNSCFYVAAPIDEVDAPRVALGQNTRITLDAFPEQEFPGRVRRIASYVLDREKQARTVEVEVEFANREDLKRLLAGYSADVEIILERREDVLRIRSEALLEGDRIYRFDPVTSTLQLRKLETGLSNWNYTEITRGVEADDRVLLSVDTEGVADGVSVIETAKGLPR